MIYIISKDNKARFALGTKGQNTLVIFGINPSTATDVEFDATIRKVKQFAENWSFDSWLMLNIYPQRSTDPAQLNRVLNTGLHDTNLEIIQDTLSDLNAYTLCAAWGVNIDIRPYLRKCLYDISKDMPTNAQWKNIGPLTQGGHPKHPSRLPYSLQLEDFNLYSYLDS